MLRGQHEILVHKYGLVNGIVKADRGIVGVERRKELVFMGGIIQLVGEHRGHGSGGTRGLRG